VRAGRIDDSAVKAALREDTLFHPPAHESSQVCAHLPPVVVLVLIHVVDRFITPCSGTQLEATPCSVVSHFAGLVGKVIKPTFRTMKGLDTTSHTPLFTLKVNTTVIVSFLQAGPWILLAPASTLLPMVPVILRHPMTQLREDNPSHNLFMLSPRPPLISSSKRTLLT
jgi:hypothetical protein